MTLHLLRETDKVGQPVIYSSSVDVTHKRTSKELKSGFCVYLVVFSTGQASVPKFGFVFAKFTTSEAEERLSFREVHFYIISINVYVSCFYSTRFNLLTQN